MKKSIKILLFIAAFVVAFVTMFFVVKFFVDEQNEKAAQTSQQAQVQTEDTTNAPLPVIPEGGGYAGSSNHGI